MARDSQGAQPGLLVAASIIMGRALGPAEQLAAQGPAIVSAFGALRRLLAPPIRADGAAGAEDTVRVDPATIEIDNCYALPGPQNEPVLKGINLRLAEGHALGIVGPAGSGKSVLVKVMIGAIRPITGSARLGGRVAHTLGPTALRSLLGYVPERTDILQERSARTSRASTRLPAKREARASPDLWESTTQ